MSHYHLLLVQPQHESRYHRTHPLWHDSVDDIFYPTYSDGKPILNGYIFVRYVNPATPLPQAVLGQSSHGLRYLRTYSHTEHPDPNTAIDIYKPYTMSDIEVHSLSDKLSLCQQTILHKLIGLTTRIPYGPLLGCVGKIKSITPSPCGKLGNSIVLVRVLHEGLFSKTYLSFTLNDLQ